MSPISLLADHPARNAGCKPGLFFVSRGRQMTNIVDGDGRSVIRKAIQWNSKQPLPEGTPEHLRALHHFTRIEMLVVQGGRKTVLVGVGATDLQAIDVGGPSTQDHAVQPSSIEVAPQQIVKQRQKGSFIRDVAFLHNSSSSLYFCETLGNSVAICRISGEFPGLC